MWLKFSRPPSTVERSLQFMVVKKLVKNLEMKTTTINGLRGEFNLFFYFSFGRITT